ncbi:MAG TPA: efflux RND transporter periplasmic adaptor subunit, partial [Polyangia bacterium]|nr:efflux RND transporter periplasmic adaptor subunit [Polyangia bacterium]
MSGPAHEDGQGGARADAQIPAGVGTMSVVRWGLVFVMGTVAALSIAYATGALAKMSSGGARAEHARLYYCPMHPSVVRDHPGECPICSMTLVPKSDGEKRRPAASPTDAKPVPGLAEIDLPADRVQLIGMRTAKVERAALADALRVAGVITANERGLSEISVRFSGWVQQLTVSETGQRVRRGEVLADVYSPEVLRAEQEY